MMRNPGILNMQRKQL